MRKGRQRDLPAVRIGDQQDPADEHSHCGQRYRQVKGPCLPAKGLWEDAQEPVHGAEAADIRLGAVNLPIATSHKRLQIGAQFGFRIGLAHAGEIGARPLKKRQHTTAFLQIGQVQGLALDAIQGLLQRLPVGALLFHEACEVDDHSNCLFLTLRYSLTTPAIRFSWRQAVRCTPHCFKSRVVSCRSLHMR